MVVVSRQYTYPFFHSGVSSKGAHWHNWALQETRNRLRSEYIGTLTFRSLMEKYHFTAEEQSEIEQRLAANGNEGGATGSFNQNTTVTTKWAADGSAERQSASDAGFLIDITDMSIESGTDKTHTKKKWTGERSWDCSCTVRYTVIIQVL